MRRRWQWARPGRPGVGGSLALALGGGLGLLLALVVGFASAEAAATSTLAGSQPRASLSAYALDFGAQTLGTTRTLNFSLTNTGSSDLHLHALSGLSGSFGVSGTCAPPTALAPGDSCVASVSFSPSVFGEQQASLTFVDDAAGAQTVTLVGVGTAAILDTNLTRLDYGAVSIGATATRTVTVTNRGDIALDISMISLDGAALSQTNTCLDTPVAPGGTCAITVRFAPTAVTTLATTLRVVSNGVRGPLLLPVSGSGVAPIVALRADPIDFGGQPMGSYAERPFVVTNTGTETLVVSNVAVAGSSDAFAVMAENCVGAPLLPSASCTVTVRFRPGRAADENASLIVRGNMPGGAATYMLTGSGLAPVPLIVQSASPRIAAARAATATLRLWITLLAETAYLSLACLLAALYVSRRRARSQPRVALARAARRAPRGLAADADSPETVEIVETV